MAQNAQETPTPIVATVEVALPVDEAFAIWGTREGLETFFASYAEIEPEALGAFEVWFFPDNEPGYRGAEGMRILAYEPGDRIAFTWNAPPSLPYARAQLAAVEVRFDAVDEGTSRVTLTHTLFGRHEEWHQTREYFVRAWPVILNRFAYRVENGPVDWANLPDEIVNRTSVE